MPTIGREFDATPLIAFIGTFAIAVLWAVLLALIAPVASKRNPSAGRHRQRD